MIMIDANEANEANEANTDMSVSLTDMSVSLTVKAAVFMKLRLGRRCGGATPHLVLFVLQRLMLSQILTKFYITEKLG